MGIFRTSGTTEILVRWQPKEVTGTICVGRYCRNDTTSFTGEVPYIGYESDELIEPGYARIRSKFANLKVRGRSEKEAVEDAKKRMASGWRVVLALGNERYMDTHIEHIDVTVKKIEELPTAR